MLTPQVQAISSAKRDSLSVPQQEAIKSVIERDPDEQDPWGPDDDDGDSSGSFAFHSFYDTLRLFRGTQREILRKRPKNNNKA